MIGGMPEIARTRIGLRIFGDALDPDEITRLLGIAPADGLLSTQLRRKVPVCFGNDGRLSRGWRTPLQREFLARTGDLAGMHRCGRTE